MLVIEYQCGFVERPVDIDECYEVSGCPLHRQCQPERLTAWSTEPVKVTIKPVDSQRLAKHQTM